MDFASSPEEERLRAEVRAVLAEPAVRAALTAFTEQGTSAADVRPLYRLLGERGLLAVNWPVDFGGRGASHTEAAAVIEELVHGGVPDMLHVLSVQIVGLFLSQAGSAEQRQRLLPELAAGRRFATVLYTEPEVGSDLAALRTRAIRDGDGYRLSGVKQYSLKGGISDIALCAARLGDPTNKYDGICLFLVDLDSPGVRRSSLPSIADDDFDLVELTDVRVGAEALLGAEGEGWSLLTRCLALERTGLDYSLKASTWYALALRGLVPVDADPAGTEPAGIDPGLLADVGRYGEAVDTGRLLAWRVISGLQRDEADPVSAAIAKYYASETAQQVAVWASTHFGGERSAALCAADRGALDAAYREAPGLTLSAGTSQIMLEMVASSALDLADGK